jgi:hypothetical protein
MQDNRFWVVLADSHPGLPLRRYRSLPRLIDKLCGDVFESWDVLLDEFALGVVFLGKGHGGIAAEVPGFGFRV